MYEIFGLEPLIKSLLIAFGFIFLSFLIGSFFKLNEKNTAIIFIVGAIYLIASFAFLNTGFKTLFTPIFLFSPFVLGINKKMGLNNLRVSFYNTLSFFSIFSIFFLIQIYGFGYFSSEYVTLNYPDFSFYSAVAENILKFKVESPFNYLHNFNLESGVAFYHYFDIYLIAICSTLGLPALFSLTYLYLSLIKALVAYILVQITFQNRKGLEKPVLQYLLAILVVLAPSFGYYEGNIVDMTSYYFPKIIYSLIVFYLLFSSFVEGELKLISFSLIISFILNPLLLIISVSIIFVLLVIKYVFPGSFNAWESVSRTRLILFFLLAYVWYGAVAFYYPSTQSVVSGTVFLDEIVKEGYLLNMINRIGYLSALKYRPFLALVLFFICVRRLRRVPVSQNEILVIVAIGFSAIGLLFSAITVFHSESFQFYQLSFEVMYLVTAIVLFKLVFENDIKEKAMGILGLLFLAYGLFYFEFNTITTPNEKYIYPVEFAKEVEHSIEDGDLILYIGATSDNWRLNAPFWILYSGIYKMKDFITIVQPITLSMYDEEEISKFPPSWRSSVVGGPFNEFCLKNGFSPENYSDEIFKKAIFSFILNYDVDAIAISEEADELEWLDSLDYSKKIVTVESEYFIIDKQTVYILN